MLARFGGGVLCAFIDSALWMWQLEIETQAVAGAVMALLALSACFPASPLPRLGVCK